MKKLLIVVALLSMGATACPAPVATPTPVDWAKCPTAAAGEVQVAVVVEGGSNPANEVVCVVVPNGATGLAVLNARAARIGTTPPRVTAAGFVCAIDGAPLAPACGDLGPNGYTYWELWGGGTAWGYSFVGAGSVFAEQGQVHGWVFGTRDFVTTFQTAPVHPSSFTALTH